MPANIAVSTTVSVTAGPSFRQKPMNGCTTYHMTTAGGMPITSRTAKT